MFIFYIIKTKIILYKCINLIKYSRNFLLKDQGQEKGLCWEARNWLRRQFP